MKKTDTVTLKLTRKQVHAILTAIHVVTQTLANENENSESEIQAEMAHQALVNRWLPLADAIAQQLHE